MRAHAISSVWHLPTLEMLRHSGLLRAAFAVAMMLLAALAMAQVLAVLPAPGDYQRWAAEPDRWFAVNVLAFQ